MRALIVDDEIPARRRLARMLEVYSDVEIIGEAEDGLAALEEIVAFTPDVVFLDIQMPGTDGFDVVRSIPPDTLMPLIIFVTSFDEHAMRAFDANAVAYLLKPVEPKKLVASLNRVRRLLDSESARVEEERRIYRTATNDSQLQLVVGRKHGSFVVLKSSDVLWFYSEEGTVRARTTTDSYWVNYQLNQLEKLLDQTTFFRARRETLINLAAIKSIKGYEGRTFVIKMNDPSETEVLVSERQAKQLRRRLPGL